jgi:hypothetical protein
MPGVKQRTRAGLVRFDDDGSLDTTFSGGVLYAPVVRSIRAASSTVAREASLGSRLL